MRRFVFLTLLACLVAATAQARRVKVKVKTPRATITVRKGFPIRRAMPTVVVRPTTVRVTPTVYLAPVVFTAAVVATLPPREHQVWSDAEVLDREDGWTDFALNVDRRGDRMFLRIDQGAAQISFAEVVFENGEAQVIDFGNRVHARGTYALADFRDGRKVDHVRVVAMAASRETEIAVMMTS